MEETFTWKPHPLLHSQFFQLRPGVKCVGQAYSTETDLFVLLRHCHLLEIQKKKKKEVDEEKKRNRKEAYSDLILL